MITQKEKDEAIFILLLIILFLVSCCAIINFVEPFLKI